MGQLDMWRIIQSDSDLRGALNQLAAVDIPRVPIHGDLRGDQILLADNTNWILDWEDFRLEDGARDVGALMGEVFYHRMRKSLASFAGGDEDRVTDGEIIERGTTALAEAMPGARTVWDAYRSVRPESSDKDFVGRSVQYFGWQLFDRALAAGTYFGRLSALDRALAGIGREAILGGGDYAEALGMTEEQVAA
jgi:aminoglycoside phosphotransferase (APT) family kinase protein